MKVLLFAASLRQESYNKKLIRIAANIVSSFSHDIDLCEFNDFPMPMYDGDLESSEGVPEAVQRLAKKFTEAEAIIIASPEYNGSIPGTLKNTLKNRQPQSRCFFECCRVSETCVLQLHFRLFAISVRFRNTRTSSIEKSR